MDPITRDSSVIADLQKEIIVDEKTGCLLWTVMYRRRVPGRPIGKALMFRKVSYTSASVAWAIQTGSWPVTKVHFVDGNKRNFRLLNLADSPLGPDAENLRKCGSYSIRHVESGRVYAGGTTMPFFKRRHQHLWCLSHGIHRNDNLQADWDKFGEGSFVFEINEITSVEDVVASEQRLIDSIDPSLLYNRIMMAGELPGRRHSDATRTKMSATHKKMTISDETRKKMAGSNKGKKRTEEQKARMSAIALKRKKRGPFTEEHKANMSKARVRYEEKKREKVCQSK